MTLKWFQIEKTTGYIVAIESMSEEDAHRNCASENVIMPAVEHINPTTHRWDFGVQTWVDLPLPRRPEDDFRFMRRTGYPDVGEQVGALVKIMAAMLSGEPVSLADRSEFDAIVSRIHSVKTDHPKVDSPA